MTNVTGGHVSADLVRAKHLGDLYDAKLPRETLGVGSSQSPNLTI